MAWDADGTVGVIVDGTRDPSFPVAYSPPPKPWLNMTSTQKTGMNDENPSTGPSHYNNYQWIEAGLVFPDDRELDGIYNHHRNDSSVGWVIHSFDTTNCRDGSWTNTLVNGIYNDALDGYRDNITSLALPSVKGLIVFSGHNSAGEVAGWKQFHVYGTISPGVTPDRVLFLDTESADAEFTKVLDYGDVPRGQSDVRTIKLKNNSTTKTINTIQITAEDLYLNAGGWYEFGTNGVDYQATLLVGNLGPGATKLVYVKQNVPDDETLGVQTGRFRASHASLT